MNLMKNISFVNVGSLILIVFLVILTTSIQESQENRFYESLPRVKKNYKIEHLPVLEHKLVKMNYEMFYVGKQTPSIEPDYCFSNSNKNSIYDTDEKKGLEILVDTTQIIFKKSNYGNDFGKSHPVFLYNFSKEKQVIGFGSLLYMNLEAKNGNGDWKPVEIQYHYYCGTGVYSYTLDENEICVSSVYKYSGDFKTKLRLRHLGNYSNEFEGYVNLDEFGEYDTEEENSLRVIKK